MARSTGFDMRFDGAEPPTQEYADEQAREYADRLQADGGMRRANERLSYFEVDQPLYRDGSYDSWISSWDVEYERV